MKEDSVERNAVKHEFFYQLDLLLLWLVYFQLAWMIAFLQLRRHLPSQELQKSPRWWNLKRELQKFGQNVTNFVWLWLWAWQLGGRFIGYSFWRKQIRIVWYFQIQVQVQVVVLCRSSRCNCSQLMLQSMRKSKQTGRLRPRPPSCCPTQLRYAHKDMPTCPLCSVLPHFFLPALLRQDMPSWSRKSTNASLSHTPVNLWRTGEGLKEELSYDQIPVKQFLKINVAAKCSKLVPTHWLCQISPRVGDLALMIILRGNKSFEANKRGNCCMFPRYQLHNQLMRWVDKSLNEFKAFFGGHLTIQPLWPCHPSNQGTKKAAKMTRRCARVRRGWLVTGGAGWGRWCQYSCNKDQTIEWRVWCCAQSDSTSWRKGMLLVIRIRTVIREHCKTAPADDFPNLCFLRENLNCLTTGSCQKVPKAYLLKYFC